MDELTIDAIDEGIIRCLQHDGRMSNRAVAREVGVSETSIRKRLRRLVELGAITYGVMVDRTAAGFAASAWVHLTVLSSDIARIAAFVGALPTCTFCMIGTGKTPIRAYVHGEDQADLAKVVGQISDEPGVIDISVRETVKIVMLRHEYIFLADTSAASAG